VSGAEVVQFVIPKGRSAAERRLAEEGHRVTEPVGDDDLDLDEQVKARHPHIEQDPLPDPTDEGATA
jgi:hypothetical protein